MTKNINLKTCYNYYNYLKELYSNHSVQRLQGFIIYDKYSEALFYEADKVRDFIESFNIDEYDDIHLIRVIVACFILYPLVFIGFINKSYVDKCLSIQNKFDILNLIDDVKHLLS